jgi:uncharacterized protein (DUF362 family)
LAFKYSWSKEHNEEKGIVAEVSIQKGTYSDPGIEGLLEPLGGMERFIDKGDKVLLKVNLLSAKDPQQAVTTHPEFVRDVVMAVRRSGGHPYIGDSPGGRFSKRTLRKAYKKTGLETLAHEENIPLNYDTTVRKLDIPHGKRLKRSSFCGYALDADKIIALPKLKTHSFQYMTLACKIMYGMVPGLTKAKYHAQFPRKDVFADILLDILLWAKPQLFILDGILAMQGQGPGSGDPIELGCVLASADPVALDMAVCKVIGVEPVGIPVLRMAKVRGLWPERIEYPRFKPEDIPVKEFKLPNTADHLLTGNKPPKKSPIVTEKCIGCGDCEMICPRTAVTVKEKVARLDYSKCIRCFCCHEVCPENAIKLGTVKVK